jgi:hypothetical protein
MSKLERPTEGELYIAYQLGEEDKEAYAKEQVIKELESIDEVYEKWDKECNTCISPYQLKHRIKELKQK